MALKISAMLVGWRVTRRKVHNINSFPRNFYGFILMGGVCLQIPAKTLPKIELQTLEMAHGTAVNGFPKCWLARTTPSTEFWTKKQKGPVNAEYHKFVVSGTQKSTKGNWTARSNGGLFFLWLQMLTLTPTSKEMEREDDTSSPSILERI